MAQISKRLPFTTFVGESVFANSLEDIRAIPNLQVFVSVRGVKFHELANNKPFNTYYEAVKYATELDYSTSDIYLNCSSQEVYSLDEIDC